MKKLIKLMPDYQCYAIWEYDNEGMIKNLNPESLNISKDLFERIESWTSKYDDTLCLDDPIKSGFSSLADEHNFKLLGESLAHDLKKELEDYEIIYEYP
ncbi:hypothetical protein OZX61_02300 [Acinetobacter sp. ESL0695]|uniref:hypothetical protein n=1 Tax=Acinetobacter sp. ESL0695 TaxID=2983215 RepID=UPI0023F3CF71|nr:hypothetical protein [Acinetobacter sp. ESL0695]WEV49340.1 hypothetical protein OZX61_02300 [Acinetobacter sp. ESL0695]